MALGKNIEMARIARKIGAQALANKAGIDLQALRALEKRDSKTSQFTAQIAAALDLSTDDLLAGNILPHEQPPTEHVKPVLREAPATYPVAPRSWPFRSITPEQWASMDEFDRGRAEEAVRNVLRDVAISKKSAASGAA